MKMKSWLLAGGLTFALGCGLWLTFAPRLRSRATVPRPRGVAPLGGEPLPLHVTSSRPTQEQIDAATRQLPRRGALMELVGKVRCRMLAFDLTNPDDNTTG